MNAQKPTGEMLLQDQLFRYATDLQELIEQHSKLQQRHQSALQSLGRTSLSRDLWMLQLLEGETPYLITDAAGNITQVSANTEPLLGESGMHWSGLPILNLAPNKQRASLSTLLEQLRATTHNAAIEMRQINFFDGRDFDSVTCFDVLIVPLKTYAQMEYFWLLRPTNSGNVDDVSRLRSFQLFHHSSKGMLMTDAQDRICDVNTALSKITGFESDEMIGNTPRLFSSGRHDIAFYKAFWGGLIDEGSWSGEFFNRRKNGQIYPEWITVKVVKNALGTTLAYLALLTDSSHHNDTEELAHLANHDALTGLPNRRLLEDRMTQSLKLAHRNGTAMSLIYIDLDRFKPVNDTLGHAVGDSVLQEVARRLSTSVRQGDTAARVGGDEFVILLQSAGKTQDIQEIVVDVLTALTVPIVVGDNQLVIGASIGCARYPKDATDTATLLQYADEAMYAAKSCGGNHFCFHDADGNHSALANLGLTLWHAVVHQELHLVYQPQVTHDGYLRGCEALLRWTHPVLGNVPPATFIPVAETNGAILPIGDWVLETACRQLQQWRQAGLHRITMSVNVSARQLSNPDFVRRVEEILSQTDTDPQDLELEITESEALGAESDGHHYLLPLQALGIKLAIDDFGTGFSSLSRLQFLPVSCLKIDQSFVRDLPTCEKAQAISQCFINMALALGMDVIAEGVETPEQHQTLIDQGCPLIQGYLTGRPMTPDALLACYGRTL